MGKTLAATVRKERIRDLILKQEIVSIPELASAFGVSEMTIRRDLDALEQGGRVRRTHGGAIPAERMVFEFDFHQRRVTRQAEKTAIAREAFRLIQPGQRIILDTGTTALELAMLVRQASDLVVITPSLAVASALQFSEGIQTILLGGILRRGSPNLAGALTEQMLDMFTADLAFQGTEGISLGGLSYNQDVQVARVDSKMREQATRSYIIADSSKIGRTALIRNGDLREISGLITDENIQPEHLRALRELGVNVILAPLGKPHSESPCQASS